jgi:energy-converting hydrogenase Eha subunit A
MLEITVIMALVMFLTGVVRHFLKDRVKEDTLKRVITPTSVFVLAVGLNVFNAMFFGGDPVQAARAGFIYGIEAAGIYGLGKAVLGKS